ncbi:DNA mismatch repair ATPase MutS subfamily 7 [Tetraselmis virus 1]|uniref:DNA mismatch repair ATPase MutS subfamily 7 n=1 Tax=Tetraselmis virus 1 TaxID=2060617 RepID=A0A2P0VN50_9VIRU|nr:DNA mismatch repair ATPase MutS subfamily 7 [Tetraselmis virus 1]AUF82335.1 DNA mismatch repair ATPase MutS subfamily 7 [Tetraselmis virus 1]
MTSRVNDQYNQSVKDAVHKYGKDTVVAFMMGGFYEFKGEQAKIAHHVAGLNISAKGVAGFPINSLEYMCKKFTDSGYIVVVMDQYTRKAKNGNTYFDREITSIYGPGNPIEFSVGRDSTKCSIVYLCPLHSDGSCTIGYATLETNTGESSAGQFHEDSESHAYSSLISAALADRPLHTQIVYPDTSQGKEALNRFRHRMQSTKVFGIRVDDLAVDPHTLNHHHIIQTIGELFSGCGFLTDNCDVYAGLKNKHQAACAFSHLINMVYRKDDRVLSIIKPPNLIDPSMHLDIAIGGLMQLDITKDGKDLFSYLPNCCTASGRRAFRSRVCRPSKDPALMNQRYDRVEAVMPDQEIVRSKLSKIYDIENIHRRMLKPALFRPHMWINLTESLQTLNEVVEYSYGKQITMYPAKIATQNIRKIIDIDGTSKAVSEHPVFASGFNEVLDVYLSHLELYESQLHEFLSFLNECSGVVRNGEPHFKVDVNKDNDITIIVTQKRFDTARKEIRRRSRLFKIADQEIDPDNVLAVTGSSKSVKVLSSDKLNEALITISETKRNVKEELIISNENACNLLYENCRDLIVSCVRDLEDIDVACACAVSAIKNGFVRPVIQDNNSSFIETKGIRHPIIEALDKKSAYIGNDLHLNKNGLLLYGINGSGKSSLMKSIGIAVIMAQAGMYVPADSFKFYPYSKLFTRIWNNDDILQGQSSFTVEMIELSEILRRGDSNSLVIGDELCSGTERVSATAIITAGIRVLFEKKAAFLLATHQHDVVNILNKYEYLDVQIKHLSVSNEDGNLVYERKLKDGSGECNYGVTVCRALNMPQKFIEYATEEVRNMLGIESSYLVSTKKSKYNSKVYVGLCEKCHKNPAVHTHHRVHQSQAPNHIKNAVHNLVPLCEECHRLEHTFEEQDGKSKVDYRAQPAFPHRMVQTSRGVEYRPIDIA